MTVSAIPYIARVLETSLRETDPGVIEAARSFGASDWQILFRVYIKESIPRMLNGIVLLTISLIGYSAMAGTVGGGGLGDIAIERVNLLNIYWEPGVTDIQKSRYFFHTELVDRDVLEEMYPALLKGKLKGRGFMSTRFLYDDHADVENKVTVVEVYYKKPVFGKTTLQYCKFVNDIVLFATENEQEGVFDEAAGEMLTSPMRETGLYDHGKYPYVFDALFPVEGSPCGYFRR